MNRASENNSITPIIGQVVERMYIDDYFKPVYVWQGVRASCDKATELSFENVFHHQELIFKNSL